MVYMCSYFVYVMLIIILFLHTTLLMKPFPAHFEYLRSRLQHIENQWFKQQLLFMKKRDHTSKYKQYNTNTL